MRAIAVGLMLSAAAPAFAYGQGKAVDTPATPPGQVFEEICLGGGGDEQLMDRADRMYTRVVREAGAAVWFIPPTDSWRTMLMLDLEKGSCFAAGHPADAAAELARLSKRLGPPTKDAMSASGKTRSLTWSTPTPVEAWIIPNINPDEPRGLRDYVMFSVERR